MFLAILEERWNWALLLFLTAVITDAFDGYVARRYNVVSKFGENVLEVIGDGSMIGLSFLGFVILGRIPTWFIIVFVLGAIIFLTYTRTSKSKHVKELSYVIQFLGYSFFVVTIAIYLSAQFLDMGTIWVVVFFLIALYLKRDRAVFAYGHFRKLFESESEERQVKNRLTK
jgi:phosphatidylglycerophosphate synthase